MKLIHFNLCLSQVSERPAAQDNTTTSQEGEPAEGASVNTTDSAPLNPPPTTADPPPPPSDSQPPVDCESHDTPQPAEPDTPKEEPAETSPNQVEAEVVVEPVAEVNATPVESAPEVQEAADPKPAEESPAQRASEELPPPPPVDEEPSSEDAGQTVKDEPDQAAPEEPAAEEPLLEQSEPVDNAKEEVSQNPESSGAETEPATAALSDDVVEVTAESVPDEEHMEEVNDVNGSEEITTPVDAQPQDATAAQDDDSSAANGAKDSNGAPEAAEYVSKDGAGSIDSKVDCSEQENSTSAVNGANGETASA